MADLKKFAEQLVGLTVLEVNELKTILKDEYGIEPAAAAVAMAAAPAGDAGPAEWTGKHLGGSPEVMHELGLAGGPRKGPVLYYFLDDPDNKVALGPIKLTENLAEN